MTSSQKPEDFEPRQTANDRACAACSGEGHFRTDEVIVGAGGPETDRPYFETCEECGGSGTMPDFAPFMLRCLTYAEVLQQMRVTGCAGRRNHWCAPVIVYEGARLIFDNEDQRDPWKPTREDRKAHDWEMVTKPEALS